MHKSIRVLLIAFFAALLCGLVAAQEQKKTDAKPAETKAAETDKPVNWYRLEIAIHELEDGKRVNTRNYTLLASDENKLVHSVSGSRVPVATTAEIKGAVTKQFQYLDVQMDIQCRLGQKDGRLALSTGLDWSSIAPEQSDVGQPIIRRLKADGEALVTTLGKPMLVFSVDDAVSKRRYQLEATVTKQ